MFAIKLDAGRDRNGNPKRIFVVFNAGGEVMDAVDEGYAGNHALIFKYPQAYFDGEVIKTTKKEYRRFLKIAYCKHVRDNQDRCHNCGVSLGG